MVKGLGECAESEGVGGCNLRCGGGDDVENDVRQFDCTGSSRNTTSLLLVLDQLKLLRHHDVDLPESRGYMSDGRPPHDRGAGRKGTGSGYGRPLEVMPLEALEDPRLEFALQKAKRLRVIAGVFI